MLDSLYDDALYRQQQYYGAPAPNPFMTADHFAASNQVAAPPAVQMATIAQQQFVMQSNPFAQPMPLQQQHPLLTGAAANTFSDTTGFGAFPVNNTHYQSNPFVSPQLL